MTLLSFLFFLFLHDGPGDALFFTTCSPLGRSSEHCVCVVRAAMGKRYARLSPYSTIDAQRAITSGMATVFFFLFFWSFVFWSEEDPGPVA